MATVQDLLNIIDNIASNSLAESWDNVGLLIGSPENPVRSILLALDPSSAVLDQAVQMGCELIITHHPAIFHPLKSLRTDQPVGDFISKALRAGINVIGCHTNLDAAPGGVSDVLADRLGLLETKPLLADPQKNSCGLGRTGRLAAPVTPDSFISLLREAITPPWLLEAGPRPELVHRVAVCGGSCSDFAETALLAGADVFVTAEIKHATARWAEESGLWLIDGGHFATENPAIQAFEKLLSLGFAERNLAVRIHQAEQKPPLQIIQFYS